MYMTTLTQCYVCDIYLLCVALVYFSYYVIVWLHHILFIYCTIDRLSEIYIYFIVYAITVVPNFPLSPIPHHLAPHSLRQSPNHCPCPWVMHVCSLATLFPMLYFTSPWLFCNYQFVLLNPLTSTPSPHTPFPSGNHQNILRIYDSVSVLLDCLFCCQI